MAISSSWGSSRTSRKGRRTVVKTKIRWDLLGLQDPVLTGPTQSMEDIRRQVSSLASRGFGSGTRSRAGNTSGQAAPDATPAARKQRRGATE